MSKIYDSRPADWDDKDEDGVNTQSSVSDYKSGKVQKNIVTEKSIVQEEYSEGKKKKLISSSKVVETSKGNIYTTYEADTETNQQANTAVESYHSKDFQSDTKKETSTINAKSKKEYIKADNTTFANTTLVETGSGSHKVSATKSIDVKGKEVIFNTDKLTIASNSYRAEAKKYTETAPHKNIKAGKVSYKIGEKLVMDGELTNSSFKQQNYWRKRAEYKHPDDTVATTFYIGEIIYSPVKQRLYFAPTSQAKEVFDARREYLSLSSSTKHNHYKFKGAKRGNEDFTRFGSNQALEDMILDNDDYIHITLYRCSVCMLSQKVLDDLNLPYIDFDQDKHLKEDDYLLNWNTVLADLLPKLQAQGYKFPDMPDKEKKFESIDNSIRDLQDLSEDNINRWLDIGKTKQASSLYMGLMMASKHNFKLIKETNIRLPNKPDVVAQLDFDEEVATAIKKYFKEIDHDHGRLELITNEEYVDSEIILGDNTKVNYQDDKYVLESDEHDRYPTSSKKNQITDGILNWNHKANYVNEYDIEGEILTDEEIKNAQFKLGKLQTTDIDKQQLTKPYKLDYNEDKDSWLIYLNTKYFLSSHHDQSDIKETDEYPNSDALAFELNMDNYIAEVFYNQQLDSYKFDMPTEMINQSTREAFEDLNVYNILMPDTQLQSGKQTKDYLKSLQNGDNKTVDLNELLAGFDEIKANPKKYEVFMANLLPSTIGKVLYMLNNLNDEDKKASEDNSFGGAGEIPNLRRSEYGLELLKTVKSRLEYLEVLEHYQPLTEYGKVKAEDSVDALWHDDGSLFRERNKNHKAWYNYLNSENMKLRTRADMPKFEVITIPDIWYVDYRFTREATDIVKDLKEEDSEDTSLPLTDLPDKDASVLCELVYEAKFLEAVMKKQGSIPIPLSQPIYDRDKKTLLEGVEKLGLSDDMLFALETFPSYYQPILAKYKLVTTSSQYASIIDGQYGLNPNTVDYYAIAVANVKDKDTSGIYVVNRGTDTIENWGSDARMALQHAVPLNTTVFCMKAGIYFADCLLRNLNLQIEYIGFTGHSLGGAIVQAQAMYFVNYPKYSKLKLSPCKTFEGYGIKSSVDGGHIKHAIDQFLHNHLVS